MACNKIENGNILPITVGGMRERYCVYEHWVGDGPFPFYLGVCKLRELFMHKDAYLNSHWQKTIKDDQVIGVRVIAISDTSYEAYNFLNQTYRDMPIKPVANQRGHRLGNARGMVTNTETGETYESASMAALKNGISQSAMSNHLNARPGYETVHGKKFRRGM